MAKAREATNETYAPEIAPESKEKWSLSGFDPVNLQNSAGDGVKLISINFISRRSYGGLNPYIEQHMLSMEKVKKQRKK